MTDSDKEFVSFNDSENESYLNSAQDAPSNDLDKVDVYSTVTDDLVNSIARLEIGLDQFKVKLTGIENFIAPLQENVDAIGQGTLEAMTGLEDSITTVDTVLCRTLDTVQGTKTQLGGTKEKVARLEDVMGGLDLLAVAQDVCQLLTTTKKPDKKVGIIKTNIIGLNSGILQSVQTLKSRFDRVCLNVNTLKTNMACFDLAVVVENIDIRFHSVCRKVRLLEKQVDDMTGLRERVADQNLKISAQDEKILALEQKLERFARYFDKMDALEDETETISDLRSKVTKIEIEAATHSNDLQRVRDDQVNTSAEIHQNFVSVDNQLARFDEKLSQRAQHTDGTTAPLFSKLSALEYKMEEVRKDINMKYNSVNKNIVELDERVDELVDIQGDAASSIELHVTSAVDNEVSSLEEKNDLLARSLQNTITYAETLFQIIEELLSGLEAFEDSATDRFSKLEKQTESISKLQSKVIKLDNSINSIRIANANLIQKSTRVNAELTVIQKETKTLFKNVHSLDGAIDLHKKKITELDKDGPAVIPESLVQSWKNYNAIRMRQYPDFHQFKEYFVYYAKAAGVPEHDWKMELLSRMSTRMKSATAWRLNNRNESFDDFCSYVSDVVQRVRTG